MMYLSPILRIALIIVSFLVVAFVLRKIRKTQLDIDDAIYWIIASALLLLLSIFPGIAIWVADLHGIQSAANFVFLFMIFVVLIKLFNIAIDVSIQKQRLNRLIQRLALTDKELADEKNENN